VNCFRAPDASASCLLPPQVPYCSSACITNTSIQELNFPQSTFLRHSPVGTTSTAPGACDILLPKSQCSLARFAIAGTRQPTGIRAIRTRNDGEFVKYLTARVRCSCRKNRPGYARRTRALCGTSATAAGRRPDHTNLCYVVIRLIDATARHFDSPFRVFRMLLECRYNAVRVHLEYRPSWNAVDVSPLRMHLERLEHPQNIQAGRMNRPEYLKGMHTECSQNF